MQANGYSYDVFFSYKRQALTLEWTRQVVQRLRFWLTEELGGRSATVFVDEDCIETGEYWPDRLRQALAQSRSMVCIWSPSYFQSPWCVSEWRSFLEREKRLHIKPHGLIAPIKFHDGEFFPEEAKQVQWLDVSAYSATVPAFWSSARALELEDKLKLFAASVARIVTTAPPFDNTWPIIEADAYDAPKIPLAKL